MARSLVSIRRRVTEEQRLDWRDPNMPVLRRWEDYGAIGWRLRAIPPEEEQEFRQDEQAQRDPLRPTWDRDPSYDWANPKRKMP